MKTELTLSGIVLEVETSKTWVAFVLPAESRANSVVKIVLRRKQITGALENISKGSRIVASGSIFKAEAGSFKLFDDECMLVGD